MKKIYLILSLTIGILTNSWCQNIVYPWRATTAIVKSGQTFEVWFNAASGQTVSSIQLKSSYITVNTTMSTVNGDWTYDPLSGNKYNRKITVTVPTTAPADRYDLVLITSSGNVTSFGGVKVINDFKSDYYVMHWSDGHLHQGGYDTNVLMKRKDMMIDIANIIDAEIIIETGDNMYNVRNHPEREVDYFIGNTTVGTKGMAKATAATFMTPGDHDGLNGNDWAQGTVQENSDFFNDYYGLQYHFFKYGNARFMNLNNAWGLSATSNGVHQYQVDNAESWLDSSGGNFLVTAGHSYDRMHKFINDHIPLDLVLAGDKHHSGPDNPWEITPGGPNIAYIVNSIRDHFQFNIFKVNNAAGTFTKPAGTTAMIDVLFSGDQDIPSGWVPNLKLTYANANTGTATSNSATIVNKFTFAISDAKVRFVVPKGNTYTVTNGTITQEFDGTTYHIVDVSTDLSANSTKVISIAKDTTVAVTSVTLTPATATISVGNTQQLTETIAPSNATNNTVTWSTNNATVATVNASGLVTAVASGTATITVTTQDGAKTDTSVITVSTGSNVMQNLQAEDATYSGAILASDQTGYKGTGFIDFVNNTGDYIQWTVNVPTAGTYELSFRYALPNGGRPLELKVNGTVKIASMDFPATGLWNTWLKVSTSQTLNAGNNTIRITSIGTNGGNIDMLSVSPYLDTCDALSTWVSAGANTLSYTTSDKKQGTGSIQMIGSATEEFKKVFSPAFNSGTTISNGTLSFWYFVSDVTKTGTVRVELGSGGAADVNELSWALTGLVNGWNQISLNFSDASQIGTPNLNALNWFRIYSTKSASITTRIDAIQVLNSATVASSQRIGKKETKVTEVIPSSEGKSVTIYPNPYKDGTLALDILGFESSNEVQLKITNLLGQVIHQEILTDKTHKELNLSGRLNEAVYFISLEAGENKVVKKLIVK
jgi:hypothetical protein